MSEELNVVQRSQRIVVNPTSKSISVISAGPVGPAGPTGPAGTPGAAENGIPPGGEPDEILAKVTGDDYDAKQDVIALVKAAGMKGIDAGPLANAIVAESLTSVLVHINKVYKVKHAGIRITGIE